MLSRSEASSSRRRGPDPINLVSIMREMYLHTDKYLNWSKSINNLLIMSDHKKTEPWDTRVWRLWGLREKSGPKLLGVNMQCLFCSFCLHLWGINICFLCDCMLSLLMRIVTEKSKPPANDSKTALKKKTFKRKKINTCQWMDPSTVFCLGFVCFFSFTFVWFFVIHEDVSMETNPNPPFLCHHGPWKRSTPEMWGHL